MFLFSHLGIGARLVKRWINPTQWRWALFGTVLPDLIDKPMFYIPMWWTGKTAGDLGFFCGTRTLAHTLLAFLVCWAVMLARRSQVLKAMLLGWGTHLILDEIPPFFIHHDAFYDTARVLFWPLLGWNFPVNYYREVGDHLIHFLHPLHLATELLGLILLWQLYRSRRGLQSPGVAKHPQPRS